MDGRKNAMVTGAGRGLGYGIAEELILAGYDVVLHYNSSAAGTEELIALAESKGQKAWAYQADIRETENITKMFDLVEENVGGLDLFVNNSGITRMSKILEPDEEMFEDVYRTNLKGAYFCVSQAGNNMKRHKIQGSIAIIGSNHLACVWGRNSVYAMFKLALSKFTQHAAMEFSKYRIRVNMVAPGYVGIPYSARKNTAMLITEEQWEERKQRIYHNEIPLGRFIPRNEVGQIILFLASPAAASITGITLIADGGAHLLHGDPKMHNYFQPEEDEE